MYKYHRCTFTSKWHFSLQARSKSRSADHNTGHRLSPGEERLLNCYGNNFDLIWSLILLWSGIIHKVKVIIVQFHVGGQYGVMQNEWFGNEEENDKIEVDDKMTTRWCQNDEMTIWRYDEIITRRRSHCLRDHLTRTETRSQQTSWARLASYHFLPLIFYLFLFAQTLKAFLLFILFVFSATFVVYEMFFCVSVTFVCLSITIGLAYIPLFVCL